MESDESVELDLSKGSNGRSISLNKNKIQPFDLKVCSPKENITTENINNNNNNNNISNHGDRSADSSPPQFNNHISPVNSETVINVSRNNFKNSLLEIFPIVNGSDPPFVSTLEGHHLWDRSLTNQHTTFSPTMSDLVGINGIPRPLFSNFANKMLLDPLKTVKSNGGNKRTSGPRSHVHNFNDELSDKMNATERETRSNSAGVISVTGDDSNASGNEGKSNGNSLHHSETELGVKSMDKDDYNDSSVLDLKISSSDAATSSSASKNTNSMVSVGSQLQPNVKRLRKDGDDIVSNGFFSSSKEDYRDKNGRQSSSSTTANATCDNGRTFPCPDCHKTFATQVDLKAHTIRHITQHPFVCMACGKGFKYDHTLDFHIKSQHNVDNGNNGNILPNGSISNSAIAGVGMGTGSYASLSSMKSLNRKSEKPHHRKNEQAQPHRNLSNPINDQTLPLDASTASLAAMVAAASAAASQNTNYGANIKNSYLMDNEDSVGDDNGCGEDANNNHLRASNPTSSSSRPTSSTLNTHTNGIPLTFPPLSLGHEKSLPHNLIAASMSKNIHNSRTPSNPSPPSFNGHSINNLVDFGLQGDLTPRSIQIKSEKVLITLLEGVHPVSKQSYSLYKCCLCGFAFPNMEPVSIHIQSRHSNHLNLTCDKCGATFKWKNELQLHDQVHKAMDQSAKCKQLIMPSFMQPNQLVLLNPYYGDSMSSVIKSLNGSSSFTGSSVLDNNNVLDCKGDQPTAYHQFHDSNNNKTTCPPNKNSNKNEDDGQQGLNLCVSSKRGEDSSKDERQTSSIPQNLLGGGSIMTRGVITSNHLANLSTKIQPSAPLNMNTLGSSPVDLKREPESLPNDDMSLLQCASFQAAVAASSTTNPSGKATEPVGDIEETAPGQFKCRFCPKTFDRVFSVHRHERVHTGYKPCICKVCGRGFSEKRNLRHHIIRFHSDGSGRELLKRVRKEKSLSAANFLKRAAVRLLSHSTVDGNGPVAEDEDNNMGGDQNNGDEHLQDVNPCEPSESSPGDENDNQTEHEEFNSYSQRKHQSLNLNKNQTELANCSSNEKIHLSISNGEGSSRYTGDYGEMHDSEKGSSSRRRKGKPSKNVRVLSSDSVGDDSSGLPQSNSNVLSHGAQNLSITNSPTSTVNIKEEMTDDMISPVKDSRSDYKESDSSDTTNGGQSDSSESKSRLHGSFFANYNPRLTLPEKPLKRNESCQPTIGPDGRLLYPCPYCPKTFCSQSDLTRHLNFHENVRPFKCEFCDYQSRTNSQLKVHMMRHAGIKQYLCSVCNYNGVTQSDLNRHCKTRSHILRSGNVCSLCSLGFSTSTLLEDHIMKFHENSSSIVHQSDDNNSRIQNYPSNGGADKKSSLNETDKAEKDSFATIVNRSENNTNHHPLKSNSDRFTVTNLL